jgi:hypothetical protein
MNPHNLHIEILAVLGTQVGRKGSNADHHQRLGRITYLFRDDMMTHRNLYRSCC